MERKKLVFILNNFQVGGVERLLLDIISELSTQYNISVVTVIGSGPLFSAFQSIPVKIYRAGIPYFSGKKLPLKLFMILLAPITLIRLILILKRVNPDMVFTSLYQADLLGIFSAKLAGIRKRILIQHDVQNLGFFRKSFKYFFAIKYTTHIVAVSDAVKMFLMSGRNIPLEKLSVIKNGIRIDKFTTAVKSESGEELTIGIMGRLEQIKGHIYFLRALKILKNENNLEPEVIVAGDGTIRKDLETYAKDNLLTKVRFLGMVAEPENFLKQIDVLVVPSTEEGFGLVALEGLVGRKIVLASDLPTFREFIQSGNNGILFPARDSKELAHKLHELIITPDLVKQYRIRLEKWARDEGPMYDIKNITAQYQRII